MSDAEIWKLVRQVTHGETVLERELAFGLVLKALGFARPMSEPQAKMKPALRLVPEVMP